MPPIKALIVEILLLPFLAIKAAIATLAFPFGCVWGCVAIGFRAGVEVAERGEDRRASSPIAPPGAEEKTDA